MATPQPSDRERTNVRPRTRRPLLRTGSDLHPARDRGERSPPAGSSCREVSHRHRRITPRRDKDLVFAEVGEQSALATERRSLSQDIEAKVPPLESSLAKVTPLRKRDRFT